MTGWSSKKRSRSAPLDIYYFRWVKQSRYPCCIAQSGAHDKPAVVHTSCPLRPPTLAGGKHTSIKKSPLPAMCMAAEDQIYILIFQQRPIFRMVRQEQFVALLSGEGGKPACLRLMPRCHNCASDTADAFLPWITVRATRLCSEGAVIYDISAGQSGQNHVLALHSDGHPLIIQHSYASGRQEPEVLRIHHPFVIAKGKEGRCDGGAGAEKGENVGLRLKRRHISIWPAAV